MEPPPQPDNVEQHSPPVSRVRSISSSVQSEGNFPRFPEPSTHSYLGNPLHESYSRNILLPDCVYDILLLPLPDVIIFPGETVPLRIQNRGFILRLGSSIRASERISNSTGEGSIACHIGIIRHIRMHGGSSVEKIGTTVEIRSTHNNTTVNDEELIVTAKGRHRFEILKVKRNNNMTTGEAILTAQVRILNDSLMNPIVLSSSPSHNPFPRWIYDVNSPYRLARLAYELYESTLLWKEEIPSLKRWGPISTGAEKESIEQKEEREVGGTKDEQEEHHYAKRKRKLTELDQKLTSSEAIDTNEVNAEKKDTALGAEVDPVGFSFYLSANLPVQSSDLQNLLTANDVIDRLKY
jgi:Lon protease-like protein